MTPRFKRVAAAVGATALATAAASLAVLANGSAYAAAPNLLANPGFESGSLSGWTCDPGTAGVVTTPTHSGSYALAATPTSSDDAQCTQTVSVLPNTAYTLSGYVEGAYVYLGITGGTDNWTPSATGWTQLSTTFTTTASQTSVQVYVHGWYAQPKYLADDLALTGPAGATTAAPTTTKATTPPPTTAPPTTAPPTTAPPTTAPPTTAPPTSPPPSGLTWKVAPYIDITSATPTLASIEQATGQKTFTLAFLLGGAGVPACTPEWGGTIALNDSRITGEISALRALGGDVAISFGGAQGPYLETTCTSAAQLAATYENVISTFQVTHLDFDIEASTNTAMMDQALAMVQKAYPNTVVSFTLEVQAATYGLTPSLGVQVLQDAVNAGVKVGIVNPMTMDFAPDGDWGTSVIEAAEATEAQMATIWPSYSTAQLYAMLGVTPMIGDNDTGPVFTIADAQQLVAWAKTEHVGRLAFWSEGRDNGGCSGGVSPTCSGVSQSTYQFTSIFGGYTG
ncbi:MAG TPA: carbohydrate binding domain-containing protein [Actinocrinis sp.]|nr:carbohydrate binding domain-containing protein [Actinocrinis sp.]